MAITPAKGYIVDPNNPNGVIRDPSYSFDAYGRPVDATGTQLPTTTATPPTTVTPPSTPTPTVVNTPPSSTAQITPDDQKLLNLGISPDQLAQLNKGNMDPASFQSLIGNVEQKLKTNNDLVTTRGYLMKHLYDSPLTPDEVSKLPPEIQRVVATGDKNTIELQMRLLNDQIAGRANTLDQSISYLTSGYDKAVQQKQDAINNFIKFAQQFPNPGDAAKAFSAIYGPDVIKQLGINIPELQHLTTTAGARYGAGTNGSLSITLPSGTIASQTNNPLNIKYSTTSPAGGTDSGIAAQDGGTFASFNSPEEGLQAAMTLLKSPTYANLTVDQAMKQWSNSAYGANVSPSMNPNQKIGSLSDTQMQTLVSDMAKRESGATVATNVVSPLVQSYVDGIASGTITSIAQVPAGLKNLVTEAMAAQGTQSPLGDRRYTLAASAIAANYIDLPGYQLTANGLPYLQRIAAAAKTPGSISDQDLLDSLTKLNTSGNAITDAQVSLITGGKSFADSVSVWKNKLGTGGVLSDSQRQQIQTIANSIYTNYAKGYQPIYDQVTKQLKTAGIPEQYWTIPDLNALAKESGLSIPGVTDSTGSDTPDFSKMTDAELQVYIKANE